MNKIAFAHPGRIGDALYCLPAIRWACSKMNCQADFYTSRYCAPMKRLVEYQPYIDKFVILDEYVVEGNGPGHQPWHMPVPDKEYNCGVYQLGFKYNPDRFLADWIARTVGAPEHLPIYYEFPPSAASDFDFIVLSPRGQTTYLPLFEALAGNDRMEVFQIGAKGEAVGASEYHDLTGLDLLETLGVLGNAKAFVGLMSASLVLANGFPDLPKFIPHDGKSWDMQHVMYTNNHHYLVDPTPGEIMSKILGGRTMETFSKTIHPDDWVEEMGHARSMVGAMSGVSYRFEHPRREWEYGLVMNALRRAGAKSVLDVGGGGSIFAPACEWPGLDMKTTTVDPGDVGSWIKGQKRRLAGEGRDPLMAFHQENFLDWGSKEKFDAVVSISTIEHVTEDTKFFDKLLTFVKKGGILALTTDFHPSGQPQVGGHIKAYTAGAMQHWANVAKKKGFEFYLGEPSWEHFSPEVNGYTFASLIMRKK